MLIATPPSPAAADALRAAETRRPEPASPVARRAPGALAAAFLLSVASLSAASDECEPPSGLSTCVVADNLWPQAGPGPWLAVGPTSTTPAGGVSFGFIMSLLSRPVGLQIASADPEHGTRNRQDQDFRQ